LWSGTNHGILLIERTIDMCGHVMAEAEQLCGEVADVELLPCDTREQSPTWQSLQGVSIKFIGPNVSWFT
jgi:hypothetical protein